MTFLLVNGLRKLQFIVVLFISLGLIEYREVNFTCSIFVRLLVNALMLFNLSHILHVHFLAIDCSTIGVEETVPRRAGGRGRACILLRVRGLM